MNIDNLRKEINIDEIHTGTQYLFTVNAFINNYKKNHPNLSNDKIQESIDDEFISMCNDYYSTLEELSGSNIQEFARQYLLKNENILSNEYKRIKNKKLLEDDKEIYTYDIQKSSRLLLKRLLSLLRSQAKNMNINLSSEDEYKYLISSLKNLEEELLKSRKSNNIHLLETSTKFLDNYKILGKLKNKYNNQLNELWLENLSYNLDKSAENPTDIGILNLLSKDNISKMPLEELEILNIFWQNKFSKELSDIGLGYFLHHQLSSSNDATYLTENFEFNNRNIYNVLLKYKFLESVSSKVYEMKASNDDVPSFIKHMSLDYTKYFSKLLPNQKNDLHTDLNQCINFALAAKNTYAAKHHLVCSTIMNFVDNKKLKNWGYIDQNNDIYGNNTIKNNDKFILLGFDYPGLNRPVKVHINKVQLQSSLQYTKETTMIPIYEGNDDYINNFKHLPTHIVLPLEKRHKEFLRNVSINPNDHRFPIIEHSIFLANQSKFPEHLKEELPHSKGMKVRKRKYINLVNGHVFVEDRKKLLENNNNER